MNYRNDKYGNPISTLGFGCMRFPRKQGKIDFAETERQILESIRLGVNYFDTAYIYPGSEATLGEILEKNGLRQQVKIATKLPHYLIRNMQAMEKLFQEQLKRLKTDYVDYYLMHMLCDVPTWNRLKEMGIEQWIEEKRRSGAIRQVGFSYHGNSETFCQLVDAYDWDFCQIQYNYMDENTQAGRRGLLHAAAKGLPVVIMEPLRGGKLVNNLPDEAIRIFKEYPKGYTPAQWAFRWLWDQKEVTCVLSGMNSMEMLRENVDTASSTKVGELTAQDQEMLKAVEKAINAKLKVPCTGCGYCLPCPQSVDIPGTFAAYNRRYTESKFNGFREYFMCTLVRKNHTSASNCIGCGKCEKHCPQGIQIRKELENAKKEMEGPLYKLLKFGVKMLKIFD